MATQTANTIDEQDETDPKDAEDAAEPPFRSYDPADYVRTFHLAERFYAHVGRLGETRTNPPITGEVIRKCIEEGECKEAYGDRHKLVAEIDGVRWELYVKFHERAKHDALTAYAPLHHDTLDLYGDDLR